MHQRFCLAPNRYLVSPEGILVGLPVPAQGESACVCSLAGGPFFHLGLQRGEPRLGLHQGGWEPAHPLEYLRKAFIQAAEKFSESTLLTSAPTPLPTPGRFRGWCPQAALPLGPTGCGWWVGWGWAPLSGRCGGRLLNSSSWSPSS